MIGDSTSGSESENYFVAKYLPNQEKREDCLFLLNPKKQIIGFCIAWHDVSVTSFVPSLHWLVVNKEYRGRGSSGEHFTLR